VAKKTYINKKHSSNDGHVHLDCVDPLYPYQTACGDCDLMDCIYTETKKAITCRSCILIYKYLKNGITTIER